MNKNWVGDKNSIFKTLGASNHVDAEREQHDYYATEPKATELLLKLEKFHKDILEPACGEGHISKVLKKHGYKVTSYDIIDRGYGEVYDFFKINYWHGDIITNPPYKYAQKFVEHALEIIPEGNKVAFFLKILFLKGKARKKLFEKNPPKYVYVSSSRLKCAKNGDFEKYSSSAVAYAWFIWEKGYKGNTIIKWFN